MGRKKQWDRTRSIVAARIVEARRELGYSQTEFGRAIGVTKKRVQNWEQARAKPPLDFLIRIAHIAKKEVGWFLGVGCEDIENEVEREIMVVASAIEQASLFLRGAWEIALGEIPIRKELPKEIVEKALNEQTDWSVMSPLLNLIMWFEVKAKKSGEIEAERAYRRMAAALMMLGNLLEQLAGDLDLHVELREAGLTPGSFRVDSTRPLKPEEALGQAKPKRPRSRKGKRANGKK